MATLATRLRQAVVDRVKSWIGGAEGSWRGPFFGRGELGGWYPLGPIEDGFQRNLVVGAWAMQAIPVVAAIRQLHR